MPEPQADDDEEFEDADEEEEDEDVEDDEEEAKEPVKEEELGGMPPGPGRREQPAPGEQYVRVRLPDKKMGELFGIADQLMGGSRLQVMCEDGVSRLARIPGKMKRRMWIREGDLVILKPWDFQDEKADIKWRYTKTQAQYLSRRGLVPKQIDVF